ncbi:MAG: LysM peptidoglycan-binding domain-containing protein [Bacilli bacterium]|nr:LysM peptidoglycan-binding domain-containing protein [Bacilli bacterium]
MKSVSGDTLYSIAKKHNTTVNNLKALNNISSNMLSVGQKLVVPSYNTYVVVPGDTLYGIAKKFNTTVDNLKDLNNLSSNLLFVNQELLVP